MLMSMVGKSNQSAMRWPSQMGRVVSFPNEEGFLVI